MPKKLFFLCLMVFTGFAAMAAGSGGVIGENKDGFSGKVYVISMGINQYAGTGYANLLAAEKDAVNFVTRLKSDSSISKVEAYLFDSKNNRADILSAFDGVAKNAGPRDAFIFFAAGQSDKGGLLFSDGSTLTAGELFLKSQNIYATRQLFFIDACHGERFIGNLKRRFMSRPEESAIGNLDRVVLAVKGLAQETREGGNFTLSYTRSKGKIMDIFSRSHRVQLRFMNLLYQQLDQLDKRTNIDFFSEKEYYTAVSSEREMETRSTIKGGVDRETKTATSKIRLRKGETLSLLIGCSNFSNFRGLPNTLNDAVALQRILEEKYRHKTILLQNPTFSEFRAQLAAIRELYQFEEGSQFLFFAATHGAKDENGTGVMLFQDSKLEDGFLEKTYSLVSIKKSISQMDCTNSLMLIDICHSGTMFDDGSCVKPAAIEIPTSSPIFASKGEGSPAFKNFLGQKTNLFIGSSTDQEAADGKGNHSPFATVVLRFLERNNLPVIDSYHLQQAISENVMKEGAISIPMFCTYACKDDGRFLFIGK